MQGHAVRRTAARRVPRGCCEDLRLPELRAHHASRPVASGHKLAAVTWLRNHEWRELRIARGCHNFTHRNG